MLLIFYLVTSIYIGNKSKQDLVFGQRLQICSRVWATVSYLFKGLGNVFKSVQGFGQRFQVWCKRSDVVQGFGTTVSGLVQGFGVTVSGLVQRFRFGSRLV